MFKVLFFSFALMASAAFASDFFDYHESLRKNNSLCDGNDTDQIKDANEFWELFELLKTDDENGRTSDIEVLDYLAYQTVLQKVSTGRSCTLIYHEDCYSSFCEN